MIAVSAAAPANLDLRLLAFLIEFGLFGNHTLDLFLAALAVLSRSRVPLLIGRITVVLLFLEWLLLIARDRLDPDLAEAPGSRSLALEVLFLRAIDADGNLLERVLVQLPGAVDLQGPRRATTRVLFLLLSLVVIGGGVLAAERLLLAVGLGFERDRLFTGVSIVT